MSVLLRLIPLLILLVPLAAGCGAKKGVVPPSEAGVTRVEPVDPAGLAAVLRQASAPVVLVNIWATWCEPCVEEFPALMRVQKKYEHMGLKVVFISADFETNLPAVESFLAKQGVTGRAYIKTGTDNDFIGVLSDKWSGAIPATFVYDARGRLRHFHEGQASEEQFTEMVLEVLKNPDLS